MVTWLENWGWATTRPAQSWFCSQLFMAVWPRNYSQANCEIAFKQPLELLDHDFLASLALISQLAQPCFHGQLGHDFVANSDLISQSTRLRFRNHVVKQSLGSDFAATSTSYSSSHHFGHAEGGGRQRVEGYFGKLVCDLWFDNLKSRMHDLGNLGV